MSVLRKKQASFFSVHEVTQERRAVGKPGCGAGELVVLQVQDFLVFHRGYILPAGAGQCLLNGGRPLTVVHRDGDDVVGIALNYLLLGDLAPARDVVEGVS